MSDHQQLGQDERQMRSSTVGARCALHSRIVSLVSLASDMEQALKILDLSTPDPVCVSAVCSDPKCRFMLICSTRVHRFNGLVLFFALQLILTVATLG